MDCDDPIGFDKLFSKNVPHLIEKIFFYLDYDSFITCRGVCRTWNELLTSESFQIKAISVYKLEQRLYRACYGGNAEEIDKIISNGMVNLDCESMVDTTPLCVAVTQNNNDVARLLLQRGADPNKAENGGMRGMTLLRGEKNVMGATPLILAATKDNREGAKLLLDNGAQPNSATCGCEVGSQRHGQTPRG